MAILTILVFYLPPDSGEKISLSISLLIALSVFSLLVADIMPPTSESLPLIGQYFLFNMTMVTLSLVMSVLVLNIHHRAGKTHRLRPWMRCVFFTFLPKLLCIDISVFRDKHNDHDCDDCYECGFFRVWRPRQLNVCSGVATILIPICRCRCLDACCNAWERCMPYEASQPMSGGPI